MSEAAIERHDPIRQIEAISCENPATLEHLGDVPVMTREEVHSAVGRARRAQVAWAGTSFKERKRVLKQLLHRIISEQDRICETAVRDSGKTMVDAALGEIFPVCEKIRYTLAHGEDDLRPEPRRPGFLVQ